MVIHRTAKMSSTNLEEEDVSLAVKYKVLFELMSCFILISEHF